MSSLTSFLRAMHLCPRVSPAVRLLPGFRSHPPSFQSYFPPFFFLHLFSHHLLRNYSKIQVESHHFLV